MSRLGYPGNCGALSTVGEAGMKHAWRVFGLPGTLIFVTALAVLTPERTTTALQNVAVQIIPVEGEGANYWTRWRGPSSQGLVSGSGYIDQWSDTDHVIWKTRVSGEGNSSPIVWKDRVFLTSASSG